jgi:hypothetical protein
MLSLTCYRLFAEGQLALIESQLELAMAHTDQPITSPAPAALKPTAATDSRMDRGKSNALFPSPSPPPASASGRLAACRSGAPQGVARLWSLWAYCLGWVRVEPHGFPERRPRSGRFEKLRGGPTHVGESYAEIFGKLEYQAGQDIQPHSD